MIKLKEMDDKVTVRDQLADSSPDPLVLINVINSTPEDVEAMLACWEKDANYFKSQPGFISTQLHKGTMGSTTFVNVAVWENVEAFRNAFAKPEFHQGLERFPDSTVSSPHLFRKVAVKGLCVV